MAKDDIPKRIEAYRLSKKLQKAEIARAIGTDVGAFGNMLRGDRAVTMDVIIGFLQVYTDVSAEWLLRGVGEMFITNKAEIEIKEIQDSFKNNKSNVNDNKTIQKLIDLLAEKDKQISTLLNLLSK